MSDYEPSLNFTALCDDEFQIERISLLTLVKEISSGNQSISFCKGLHMVPELSPNLFLERAQFAVTPYPCNCCLQSCFHSKALSHRVNSLQENFQAHIYLLLCVCDIAHSLKSSLIMKRPSVFSKTAYLMAAISVTLHNEDAMAQVPSVSPRSEEYLH